MGSSQNILTFCGIIFTIWEEKCLQGVFEMLKKTVILCLIIVLAFSSLQLLSVGADSEDYTGYDAEAVVKIMDSTSLSELKAKGAVLIDYNSATVLQEKNCHDKLPLASVTKIMSMLLVMEAIETQRFGYDTQVSISEHASNTKGTSVWIETGERYTVEELLKAVAIRSANDATVALAEAVAGSEEAFVVMMNEKASELGMKNTKFLDCSGLTDVGHYSSAYDVALMSRALLMDYPEITKYTTVWQGKFRENKPGKSVIDLDNTNKLVRFYDGTVGLKTGFTQIAGHCLSASAVRNGQQFIAVVLGEPDSNTRFAECRKLLDYGFANFETTKVDSIGDSVREVAVKKGLSPFVMAVYKEDVKLLLKKGKKGEIERVARFVEELTAPVAKGQKVGEITYLINDEEVGKTELIASSNVPKATFVKIFCTMMLEWFSLGRTPK